MSMSSKSVRILLVTDVASLGGSERRLLLLAKRWSASKYRLFFCSLSPDGPLLQQLRTLGYETCALGIRRGLDYGPGLLRLIALIRRLRPTIIHGQIRYAAFLAALAGRLTRVPVVVATRTYTALQGGHSYLDCGTGRLADHVVAVSEAAARVLREQDRVPLARITVIPNGVDTSRFRPRAEAALVRVSPDRATLISVGNLHAIKGHDQLIRALPLVRREFPQAEVCLVGDGPWRGHLEAEASRLGVGNAVRFAGFLDDVVPHLQSAQVFVLPSRNEGMSNALLEAMAVGLPVVATRVGGNGEVVEDGVSGLLVPADDPEVLAEGIAKVLRDPVYARSLGDRAAQRVAALFSFDATLARYEALYDTLLSRHQAIVRG